MKLENLATIMAIALVAIAALLSHNTLEQRRTESLEKSIEVATQRGIDPVAVRCAYADKNDTICVVYASKSTK